MNRHRDIRRVAPELFIRALFGGFVNQFGWGFFGFGMIFFWVFGSLVSFDDVFYSSRELQKTTGLVVEIRDTNASEDDARVQMISFAFVKPGSNAVLPAEAMPAVDGNADSDFVLTQCYQTATQLNPGQRVEVEFPLNKPHLAKISGTRRGIFPVWVLLLVGIFPFIGLVFMFFGIRRGLLIRRLLSQSCMTFGVLIGKEPTNTRVNNQTVMKLTFSFETHDGRAAKVVARTHEYEHLVDEAEEPLLYNPVCPAEACLLDDIPGRPRLDEYGCLAPRDGDGTLTTLLVPAAAIAINLFAAAVRFIVINP